MIKRPANEFASLPTKIRLRGFRKFFAKTFPDSQVPREYHGMRAPFNQFYAHLVWGTWDRLPLLSPSLQNQAYAVITRECRQMNVQVFAIGGMSDHVHLLVHPPLTLATSDFVKQVKGASSHLLNRVTPGMTFKWQGAYGYFSVSPRDVEMIKGYILNQEAHHRQGSLQPDFELPL